MLVYQNWSSSRSIFDWDSKKAQLAKLTQESESPTFWDNSNHARETMKTISDLSDELGEWENLYKQTQALHDLAVLNDESLCGELEEEIQKIEKRINTLEFDTLLSGPYDKGNAILSLNAGAGGTDAQDWAAMLERMYLRWAERSGFKTEIIHLTEGEEAGIKSITIAITGKYAYGYLRAEKGVHRLVRLSPFDAAHRRHTSFVQVEVLPEVTAEDPEITINPDDLEIDVFKSAGAGGQNVQKNATAIRITHKPTGIVVTCQNERSQLQNKENALKVLRGRLYQIKLEEQEKQISALKGEFQKIEWGSQIRSYVLHPYQMVKDHRTDYEEGNTQAVLDGEIDGFIQSYLKYYKR